MHKKLKTVLISGDKTVRNLNNWFDIAHADALHLIKINEDNSFLQRQREPGRPDHLGGVDKKLSDKEEKARLRIIEEEKRDLNISQSQLLRHSSYDPLQKDYYLIWMKTYLCKKN